MGSKKRRPKKRLPPGLNDRAMRREVAPARRKQSREERKQLEFMLMVRCRQAALGGEPYLFAIRFPQWHADALCAVAIHTLQMQAYQRAAQEASLSAPEMKAALEAAGLSG